MKRTHKLRARLLSAGLSLALLTTLLPGALAASADVSYDVDSDDVLYFEKEDFDDYCQDETNGDYLDYIEFSNFPSSKKGTLYFDYDTKNEFEVDNRDYFTYEEIDDLAFVPNEDFDGLITIDFGIETSEGDYVTGELEIDVYGVNSDDDDDEDGDVTYETDVNDEVYLDVDDFDDYMYDATDDGLEVEYIYFTSLPSSSKGTLYYEGSRRDEEVEKNDDYDREYIDYLFFVPDDDYEGTVTIPFKGKADSGESFSGDLVIIVGESRGSSHTSAKKGDVTYNMDSNDEYYFDAEDFNDYCLDETDYDLDKICFTDLPSSSKGVLYFEDDEKVDEDDVFRYREIDDLTFVSARSFEGVITIPFTILNEDDETIDGDLVINVGLSGAGDVVVELTAATGSPLTFSADAFNEACLEEMGSNLSYVIFDYTSGRGGYLYYNYGENTEDEVGSARYYRSSSPSLSDVTFVPGSAAGTTTTIPFEGYTTGGKSFDGEVEITYVTLRSPSVVSYTSNGLAVDFQASDFSAACAARGGAALVSVTFPNPSVTGGQLYYSFTSPTQYRGEVVSSVTYEVSGIYQLSGVTFLPKAEYTGTVVIPYVGTDADGITYNGNIQITITPPTSTTRFNDMGSYSWAVPGVEFLAAYGITTGTNDGTTYSPAGTMTRGDYILMLVRTFGLTSSSTANFNDVKADAYYASALATAKALGIITADANGNFRPTEGVTRQDSMVFLYRAMQAANRTVPTAYDSYLTRFPDGASVAADARQAVAAMAQAGVIIGDQAGRLNPTSTLTRGEMAVILHRALTL